MKKVLFIATISLTLLASCKETPKNTTAPTMQEEVKKDNNAEMMMNQDSIKMASKKTLDSLEQVKSHGHAH
ncbi:hypothetical protein OO010_13175 [Flavobacteriaceae bacterium KMM 6898]|nr:hypothetical protein [Flavobacteriaceae bacterium KMM 6898]